MKNGNAACSQVLEPRHKKHNQRAGAEPAVPLREVDTGTEKEGVEIMTVINDNGGKFQRCDGQERQASAVPPFYGFLVEVKKQ